MLLLSVHSVGDVNSHKSRLQNELRKTLQSLGGKDPVARRDGFVGEAPKISESVENVRKPDNEGTNMGWGISKVSLAIEQYFENKDIFVPKYYVFKDEENSVTRNFELNNIQRFFLTFHEPSSRLWQL